MADQLTTALELRELSSTVNSLVSRVEDLTNQLTTLEEALRRDPALTAASSGGNGNGASESSGASTAAAAVKETLDQLKRIRAGLVREGSLNYRYPPKLREEVNSLMNSVMSPIAAPTESQKLRLKELADETAKVVSDLNVILTKSIPAINERLSGHPHVVAGPALK
jgi:hypothetical protein